MAAGSPSQAPREREAPSPSTCPHKRKAETHGFDRIILTDIASPLLLASLYFLVPDNILPAKVPGTFLRAELQHPAAETVLAPALCWYFVHRDIFLMEEAGEFAYGLTYLNAEGRDVLKDLQRFSAIKDGAGARPPDPSGTNL